MERALARAAAALAVVGLTAGAVAPRDASAEDGSRRAWLGMAPGKGPSGGVVATYVVHNSPAARAGVAVGDLILKADGVPLTEPQQLVARVAMVGPGGALPMRIRHGTTERDVTAALIAFPGPEQVLRLDKVGTFAPGWKSATTVSGSLPATVAAARGRVLLVDFWASSCAPCRMMAPQLSQWQATYGAQGLSVIGFTDDPVALATQTAQAWGMSYTLASDEGLAVMKAYGTNSLPTVFLIDKKGVIRDVYLGFDPARHRDMERSMMALLAEPAP